MNRLMRLVDTEAAGLRKDLKALKQTSIFSFTDVNAMYAAASEQHRHLKLCGIVGTSEPTIRKILADAYLYRVLVAMLLDASKREDEEQILALESVSCWYESNRHKLTQRPTFKARTESPTALMTVRLPGRKVPRKALDPERASAVFPSRQREALLQLMKKEEERAVGDSEIILQAPPASVTLPTAAITSKKEEEEEEKEKEVSEEKVKKEDEKLPESAAKDDGASSENDDDTVDWRSRCKSEADSVAARPCKSREQEVSESLLKTLHPITSYVTPFGLNNGRGQNQLKGNSFRREEVPPSWETLHRVLEDHSHGARYKLWCEKDEMVLRERRVQAEIAFPQKELDMKDFQEQCSLHAAAAERPEPISPAFADCDTEEFLRISKDLAPAAQESPRRPLVTTKPRTSRSEDVAVKEAIDAVEEVSRGLLNQQVEEMANVRWEASVQPLRLLLPASSGSDLRDVSWDDAAFLGLDLPFGDGDTPRERLLDSAIDWRGRVTPSSPHPTERRQLSSGPFQRHSYLKRLIQQQRSRQPSPRIRPLSAPGLPGPPAPTPTSVPDAGRETPPGLDRKARRELVRIKNFGGSAEDPWERWLRRYRHRRFPIRRGPLPISEPQPMQYLSLTVPPTALEVGGDPDSMTDYQQELEKNAFSLMLASASRSTIGESLTAPPPPPPPPPPPHEAAPQSVMSYSDMCQQLNSRPQRAKTAFTPRSDTTRLRSAVTRSPPSIPSARDPFVPLASPLAAAVEARSERPQFRLLKSALSSGRTLSSRDGNRSSTIPRRSESKETLSVVGLTLNNSVMASKGLEKGSDSDPSQVVTPLGVLSVRVLEPLTTPPSA